MQMKSSAWQHRQQTLQAFKNLPIACFLISTITLLSPSQIPVLGRLQCMNLIQLTWPLWVLTSYLLQKTHHQSSLYFTSQKLYRPVPWMWGMLCCNWTRALLIQQNCMPCSLLPPHWTIPLTSQSSWIRKVQSREPLGRSNLNTYISKFGSSVVDMANNPLDKVEVNKSLMVPVHTADLTPPKLLEFLLDLE